MDAAHRYGLSSLILLSVFACESEAPVWDEIPPLTLAVGGLTSLDLDDYVDDPDGSDELLLMAIYGGDSGTVNGSIDASTHVFTAIGASDYEGSVVFEVTASDPDGNVSSVFITVEATDGDPPIQDIPQRSCATAFSFDAGPGVGTVAIAGTFNGWDASDFPLSDDDGDGIFDGAKVIAQGDHQYKVVLNGSEWIEDPGNPLKAWDGDFVNSALRVGNCTQPQVEIFDVTVNAALLKGSLQFTLGNGQDTLPLNPIILTVAGQDVAYDLDETTGLATFSLPAGLPGKYTIIARGQADDGTLGESSFHPLWVGSEEFDWRDGILYFAMTDRFYNGNIDNDGFIDGVGEPANYQGGDWDGITQKIEDGYFDDLGVNAIWLSPIRNNPEWEEFGADGRLYTGYHGYWPTSSSLENGFGGAEALKELVDAAHQHGIRVMLDLVANHVHDAHPWFSEHPDWFNDYDYCGDGGSWDLNPVGCWFTDYLPDLDYKNSGALFSSLDVSLALVTEYDLDAVRLDAVKHMESVFEIDYIAGLESTLEKSGIQMYTVGETFVGPWDEAGYNQGLIQEHIGPGLLDGQFDFPLYWEVIKTFARDEQGMDSLAWMMAEAEGYYGQNAIMSNFLGNHDIPRFISHANGDIGDMWGNGAQEQGWVAPPGQPSDPAAYERLRLGFSFLMTIKGVPLIYYGDEIGLAGAGDPDNRRFMPWGAVSQAQESTRTHVGNLAAIRGAHKSLSRGEHLPLFADGGAMAYGRRYLNDKAVVVLNKGSSRALTVDVSALGFANGDTLEDALGSGSVVVSNGQITVNVDERQAMIFFPEGT